MNRLAGISVVFVIVACVIGATSMTPDLLQSVPVGTIVSTENYNDETLIRAGFTLMGEQSGVTRYSQIPRMNVSAGSWAPTYVKGNTTQVSAPTGNGISAWAGDKMYVYHSGMVHSYNPAADTWTLVGTSTISLAAAANRQAIWTGTELIVWGGAFTAAADGGVRYNPSTNTWSALATENQPSGRMGFSMIWAADRMIVWGGYSRDATLADGAMYDPASNSWTPINNAGAPSARRSHTAVWNTATRTMIVWGGSSTTRSMADEQLNTGACFNPAKNAWTGPTPSTGAPLARHLHTAVWTGTEMIVFGGLDYVRMTELELVALNSGGRYNPATNTWRPTAVAGAPYVADHDAVWTGSAMLVTGGYYPNMRALGLLSSGSANASLYDPATNVWRSAGTFNFSDLKSRHSSYVAGDMVLIWGGLQHDPLTRGMSPSNTGYRYFLRNSVVSVTTLMKNHTLYLYRKN